MDEKRITELRMGWSSKTAIDECLNEIERLKVERNKFYRPLNRILEEVKSRRWICDGRGPYAYDDDDYRRETGWAFDAIEKIALEARAFLPKLEENHDV